MDLGIILGALLASAAAGAWLLRHVAPKVSDAYHAAAQEARQQRAASAAVRSAELIQ